MQKAVAYVRVSSKDQTNGYSISAQKRLLKEYAQEQGFDLVKLFEEDYSRIL